MVLYRVWIRISVVVLEVGVRWLLVWVYKVILVSGISGDLGVLVSVIMCVFFFIVCWVSQMVLVVQCGKIIVIIRLLLLSLKNWCVVCEGLFVMVIELMVCIQGFSVWVIRLERQVEVLKLVMKMCCVERIMLIVCLQCFGVSMWCVVLMLVMLLLKVVVMILVLVVVCCICLCSFFMGVRVVVKFEISVVWKEVQLLKFSVWVKWLVVVIEMLVVFDSLLMVMVVVWKGLFSMQFVVLWCDLDNCGYSLFMVCVIVLVFCKLMFFGCCVIVCYFVVIEFIVFCKKSVKEINCLNYLFYLQRVLLLLFL